MLNFDLCDMDYENVCEKNSSLKINMKNNKKNPPFGKFNLFNIYKAKFTPESFWKKYSGFVENQVLIYLQSDADKDDLTQEVFIKVFRSINEKNVSFVNESAFNGWLKKIVRNECYNFLNKKKKLSESSYEDNNYDDIESNNNDQSAEKIKEEIDFLNKIAEKIKNESVKKTIKMYLSGFSTGEIMKNIGVTMETVKSRKKEFKKICRGLVAKKGLIIILTCLNYLSVIG